MEYTAGRGTTALGVVGTVLGSIGTAAATGVLGNGMGLFGNGNNWGAAYACSDNMAVNRYELGQEQKIAKLESEIALRDANIYSDRKSLELYGYVDGRMRNIEAQLASQAVTNAQITANISCMQGSINTLLGLTKTVVPITNICPQPMPQYNSWVAPTETATPAG